MIQIDSRIGGKTSFKEFFYACINNENRPILPIGILRAPNSIILGNNQPYIITNPDKNCLLFVRFNIAQLILINRKEIQCMYWERLMTQQKREQMNSREVMKKKRKCLCRIIKKRKKEKSSSNFKIQSHKYYRIKVSNL